MQQVGSPSHLLAIDAVHAQDESHEEERWPVPLSILFIATASLAMWTGIGFGIRWLIT
jgi:hypothetical protein